MFISATNFLKEELETARKKLESIESNWTAFKIAYSGRTPEDRQSNLSTLQSIETRMQSNNAAMSRVNQEKMMLETQQRVVRDRLASAKNPTESPVTAAAVEKRNEKLLEKEREIQLLENNLIQAREHYTDVHPDVKRYDGMLTLAKRQRDAIVKDDLSAKLLEAKAPPKDAPKKAPVMSREAQDLEATDIQLVALMKAKEIDLDEFSKEVKRLNDMAKSFQSRLDSTPVSDQKFQELSRDYEQAKRNYTDMSEKKTISERATIITGRKQGETLEMLDPASLPLTPTDPNRYMIIGGGTAAGLLLGLFLAGGREMKDTALKNLKDVRAYTQLTILGCVPLLENDLVVRRRRRLAWLAWSTATILGIVVMAGSVFYYFSTKQ